MAKKNVEIVNNGGWNTTVKPEVPMTYMHVEIEWLEKALGTSPNNKELLAEYIASNAPDALSKEQEVEALGEDNVFAKGVNIYPKGQFSYDTKHDRFIDGLDKHLGIEPTADCVTVDRIPYYYNYQIRGAFKDSCGLLARADKDTESGKLKAYKKVIDGGIFVFPRRIGINVPETYLDDDGVTILNSFDENGNLPILQRPIRTSGPSGERVAIAASEQIPAGSTMKFTIGMTSEKFKPAVIEWLNYFSVHGISGWRNSGMGICRWREIQENYLPYTVSEEA